MVATRTRAASERDLNRKIAGSVAVHNERHGKLSERRTLDFGFNDSSRARDFDSIYCSCCSSELLRWYALTDLDDRGR